MRMGPGRPRLLGRRRRPRTWRLHIRSHAKRLRRSAPRLDRKYCPPCPMPTPLPCYLGYARTPMNMENSSAMIWPGSGELSVAKRQDRGNRRLTCDKLARC